MKKVALVLSGGGFKGAFQLGALQYLRDNWQKINPTAPAMKFDIIAGVSVGALNGALLAAGKFDALEGLWRDVAEKGPGEIYQSDFITTADDSYAFNLNYKALKDKFLPGMDFDKIPLGQILKLALRKGQRQKYINDWMGRMETVFLENFKKFRAIADNTPLKKKLEQHISLSDIKDCTYMCGYVSLNSGGYYAMKHSDFVTNADFINGILASTTMPLVWEPVEEINTLYGRNRWLVDGGIKSVSPLNDVIEEINRDNAEYLIIVINCSSGTIEEEDFSDKNIVQITLRALNDIAITEIFNNDLELFLTLNDIVQQVKAVKPDFTLYNYNYREHIRSNKPLRPFKCIVIQPATGVLGDTLATGRKLIERRIAHGIQKAKYALLQYKYRGS